MPVKTVVSEAVGKMKKTIEFLQDELKGVRTGRASTGLVEHLKVEYYGNPAPIKSLATLSAPQADTVLIKPFDPSSIKDIEKAIRNSDLSIAPMVEGKMIRLNVPPLSEERRKHLVNQIKQMGEQAKVSIRNSRRDGNKQLEHEEKESIITEDDLSHGKKQIDDETKKYTSQIDDYVKQKADEVMSE